MKGATDMDSAFAQQLLNLFAVPAYVTDVSNRIRAVNQQYARLVGDPLADGIDGDDLFVQSLVLRHFHDRFPRRRLEVSGCTAGLLREVEKGNLAPRVGMLLGRTLKHDKDCARLVRSSLAGDVFLEWDGFVRLRPSDDATQEFSETVIPLASKGDNPGSPRYLNLWTRPGQTARSEPADMLLALTPREREVAALYAQGKSAPEVARILSISTHTAHDHRDNIYSKLGVHSRAELARLMP